MLKKPATEQAALEIVTLDQLVLDPAIEFLSIRDRVAGLHRAAKGYPPLDSRLMFKALPSATCLDWAPIVNCYARSTAGSRADYWADLSTRRSMSSAVTVDPVEVAPRR